MSELKPKTVVYVGEYFTLLTTVKLEEALREEGEDDFDFAVRLGAVWLGEYYGWDILKASKEVDVLPDEDEDESE